MVRLLIIGAGGYGRALAEVVTLCGEDFELLGFVDDRWPEVPPLDGLTVLGRTKDLAALRAAADAVVVAIGQNPARRQAFNLATASGFTLPNLIHPRAWVSPSATLGRGLTIMAGAIIGTEAKLADGALVNAGAVIDHHGVVGAFGHVGVGASMGGGAILGPGAWLKAGQVLAPGGHLQAVDFEAQGGA